ncbi:AsnC family transcriptional regulator [uncultured Desulfobacter sp.]|uniref:Lrp/AsnC family transcriptional regulator n=1 Tax=uncultured Desulfobacter sp. TaxID=240139 RepID=UPI002AAB79A4|nr:AsnC family transcriptional regulator [uncultured Desulfobacter sp.]
MNSTLDDIDSKIINLLKKNGRMPNTEVAAVVNLSETAIRNRVKRLIDDEIIQIVAVVNPRKIGYELEGNIKIKTNPQKNNQIKKKLLELSCIWYLAHLAGAFDFDMEFHAKSQEELRDLIEAVNQIDGILGTEISIRIELLKNRYDLEK